MKIFLTPFCLFLFFHLPAQRFEWLYTLDNEPCCTSPARLYLDQEGNVYANLFTVNPHDSLSHGSYSLISLTAQGQFLGRTYVNFRDKIGTIMPLGKNIFFTASYYQNPDQTVSQNMRLYNGQGELIKEGPDFKGSGYAGIPTKNGFLTFTHPLGGFVFSSLIASHIDRQLNVRSDTISLKPLYRSGKGIHSNPNDAHFLKNSSYVIPFHYGEDEGGQTLGPDNGMVACIKGNQILWNYPDTLSAFRIEAITTDGNDTWVVYRVKRGNKLCVRLNAKGESVFNTTIHLNSDIKDLTVYQHQLLLLTNYGLFRYSPTWELIREYRFEDYQLNDFKEIQLVEGNTFILTCEKWNIPCIGKLILDDEIIDADTVSNPIVPKTKPSLEKKIAISSMQVEPLEDDVLMVNLYPNPTTISITIEFISGFVESDEYHIQVLSSKGEVIENTIARSSKIELNVSELVPGNYFYKIFLRSGDLSKFIAGQFIKL